MQDFSARQSLASLRQSYVSRRQALRPLTESETAISLRLRREAERSVRLADRRQSQRPLIESELVLRRRAERRVRLERLEIIRQRQVLISSATDRGQILELFWSHSVRIRWLEKELKEQTQRLLIEKEELISRLLTRLINGTRIEESASFLIDLMQMRTSLFESFLDDISLLQDLRETQWLLTQSEELITRKLRGTHNTQSEEFATNLSQRVASLFQSYADDIRRLDDLQEQTQRLLTEAEQVAVRESLNQAAVLRPKPPVEGGLGEVGA